MRNAYWFCFFLSGAAAAPFAAQAQSISATLNIGGPAAVAVNPITNKIYIANSSSGTVTVIDGATNNSTTVNAGANPFGIAVNAATNTIYVVNANSNDMTVIDGATNSTATVKVGAQPASVAVNPVTNRIYVGNQNEASVTVIDGATNSTLTVATRNNPIAIGVNPVTNKIYIACLNDGVTVIDGATNTTIAVNAGVSSFAIAVNAATNKVYVCNWVNSTVTVIDGSTNATTRVNAGTYPQSIVVNPVTNKIYAANNASSGTVTVIDGVSNSTSTVAVGSQPNDITVDITTNKIYVTNAYTFDVTVIDGTTNATITVYTGTNPANLAINPITDKIYVCGFSTNQVSVIDGATNTTISLNTGSNPNAVSVNAVTNKVYVGNTGSDSLTIIDGASNSSLTVSAGPAPGAVAINPTTNKIYVTNSGNALTVIDGISNTTATVKVGASPVALGVNPVTNRIYVANNASNSVTVIDGATNLTTVVTVGVQPGSIAVNPVTNKVYVLNTGSNNVTAIDGATNATATVNVGMQPNSVAVNAVTNKIYVSNYGGNSVTVIDGVTNATVTLQTLGPKAIAVNTITNKIYVLKPDYNAMLVIDGVTNSALLLPTGNASRSLAVNPVTNKIYVTNGNDGTITAFDGLTYARSTVIVGSAPAQVAVNPATNRIYVSNQGAASVTVIVADQSQIIPLSTSISALPGNVTTSFSPFFTFTAQSLFGPVAPPVRNVFFQVDTWQGPWTRAAGSGSSLAAAIPAVPPGFHTLYAFATDGQESTSVQFDSPMTGGMAAYGFLVAPPATHFAIVAPATATLGTPFAINVVPLDALNSPTAAYSGTVSFTSSDGAAVLPANVTLANGSGVFAATFKTSGAQTLTVTDAVFSSVTGSSGAITVCSFILAPTSATVSAVASTGIVGIAAPSGCGWTATSNVAWLNVALGAGSGNGTVSYSVSANVGVSSRTGSLVVAGQTFTVTQSGVAPVPTAVSVSPSAGAGTSQTFTAVYSDTAGAAALNRRLFLINSSLNGAGGCFVQTDNTGIYLVNDAGAGLLGPAAGSNTFSNSQCTLSGAGTGVVNSGNNSTVTLALSFAPGFAGAKTIYLYTEDSAGNTGFQPLGSFTISAPAAPAAVSVTPSSGSGSAQTFTAVYSDTAGATYLKRRLFLINSSLNGTGACFVQADPSGIYLVNDVGSGLLGPIAPGGTLTNSQCSLNGTGTALANSGNNSTLTVSLTFNSAFAGGKNIYMYTEDSFGGNSGFQTRGTYAVPFSAPTADSVSPAAGSGTAQIFTAVYSDASGASVFNRRLFVINSVLNGAGACFVQTDPTGIYLVNDAGSGLLGPIAGSNTFSNSQCTLNGTGTSVVNSGNTSTVTISITFKPTFGGTKNIYMYAEDNNGNNSGFQTRGTYTIAFAVPTADSVTPSSASGTSQTFTATYSDGSGAATLNRRLFLIASALNGAGACFVQADPTGLYLVNDADSALLGPVAPGGSASNNQCTLNGTGSSVSNSGASSTVTLSVAFKPAFAGTKNIYMYADDANGNNSGFQTRGTYSVTGTPSVPATTSVTPNSGAGASQTFTLVYSDAAGNSLLNRRLFLINSILNGSGACLVQVDATGIYLANDADSALVGPLATNSSLTNSQCTLNGAGSSVSYSATSTTVVLPITFKPAFGGSRNLYMYADDTSGNNSGWQTMGSIVTQ